MRLLKSAVHDLMRHEETAIAERVDEGMPVDIHVNLPQKEDYRSRARASDDLDWTCTVVTLYAKIDRKAGLALARWAVRGVSCHSSCVMPDREVPPRPLVGLGNAARRYHHFFVASGANRRAENMPFP